MAKSPSTHIMNKATLEAWAQLLIKRWEAKIETLGVTGSGNLVQSFRHTVEWESRSLGGEQVEFLGRVKFAFNYYGKMLDYGLGRGTDLADRFGGGKVDSSNPRKRKEWIVEPFVIERKILVKLIKEQTATYTTAFTKAQFEKTHAIEFKTEE